jgi:hypothetical protein
MAGLVRTCGMDPLLFGKIDVYFRAQVETSNVRAAFLYLFAIHSNVKYEFFVIKF